MTDKIMSAREIVEKIANRFPTLNEYQKEYISDYFSQCLTAQAKLYEGQIDSLEVALGWSDRALKAMHIATKHNAIETIPVHAHTAEALANLAEFRKEKNNG